MNRIIALLALVGCAAPLDFRDPGVGGAEPGGAQPGDPLALTESSFFASLGGVAPSTVYTVRLPTPTGGVTVTFVDVGGVAVSGDMVLGQTEDLLAQSTYLSDPTAPPPPNAVQPFTFSRWPDGVVPYTYAADLDPSAQAAFDAAVAHWQTYGPLTFRPADGSEEGWVHVTSDDTGCHSLVGYGTGARQLNLQPSGCFTGQAIHEVGHAVGFFHEQSRSDRDNYVSFYPENLEDVNGNASTDDEAAQFATWVEDGAFGWDLGVYDYGSIMHYASSAFGDDATCVEGGDLSGCVLLTADGEFLSETQRTALSTTDIWSAWRMYDHIWQLSSGGDARWSYVLHTDTTFAGGGAGDLDGDGWDEAVVVQADGLWAMDFATGTPRQVSGALRPTFVRVGDFDGDGRSDLLTQDGRRWVVKWRGLGRWQDFGTRREDLSAMVVGDVNGDGRDDLLRDRSGTWSWSSAGTGAWSRFSTGMPAMVDARVGDVDGDGRADVVAETAGVLRVRQSSSRAWVDALPTGDIADTVLVDQSGDGVLDVAWADGGTLRWADVVHGLSDARPFDQAGAGLLAGDFDGDGTADLLAAVAPFGWDASAELDLRPDGDMSLEEAIRLAEIYGVTEIFLLDGTYTLPQRACLPSGTHLFGRDASVARIEGGDDEGLLCAWQATDVRIENVTLVDTSGEAGTAFWSWESEVALTGVAFEGGADSWGVFQHGGTVTMNDVRFNGMERGLVAEGGELVADRLVVDDPVEVGIDLSRVSGQLTSSVFLGSDIGMRVSDVAPAFANLTFVDQGSYGIYAEQQHASYWITLALTNVAFDGAAVPLYGNFYWGYVLLDSVYYRDGSWPGWGGWYSWTGAPIAVSDPGIDPADGHLVKASPLIDIGSASILSGLDIDGEARSLDGDGDGTAAPDVGADEYSE